MYNKLIESCVRKSKVCSFFSKQTISSQRSTAISLSFTQKRTASTLSNEGAVHILIFVGLVIVSLSQHTSLFLLLSVPLILLTSFLQAVVDFGCLTLKGSSYEDI